MGRLFDREWREMLARSFHPSEWWGRDDGELVGDQEAKIMWVYRTGRSGGYEVGYWDPDRKWFCDSTHDTIDGASRRVRWLNGGQTQSLSEGYGVGDGEV